MIRVGAAALLLLLGTGCGDEATDSPDAAQTGPLLVSGPGDGSGDAAIVAGEVTFEDGCLLLGRMPVVWPEGTTWDADTPAVVLPNGDAVAMGDEVTGGGGYHYADTIAEGVGARGAELAAECAGPTNEVAVFNAGSEVVRVD
jgi:hypothetical protein